MSGWGMPEVAAALPEVAQPTKAPVEPEQVGETEMEAAAQAHGWVTKTSYDYETYNMSSKELQDARKAALAAEAEAGEGQGEDNGVMGVETGGWASNAAIYEFNEEYGEVGPAVPALEKQLFGGEFVMRTGIKFEK
jgi:ATP-dependent RNA helicase DDX3X